MTGPPLLELTTQKLRGGYYTPPAIARFLASWAVQSAEDTILEPSCGDGEVLAAAARRLLALGAQPEAIACQAQGVELYAEEAEKARARLRELGVHGEEAVAVGDFFDFDGQAWGVIERQFDVAIGNPPFLRYHSFPEEQRHKAFRIMQTAGLSPNKLTNSWTPFLIAASLRLKKTGRLAMVIPAELLQVKYAEETRAFLSRHFGAITLITFRRLVFAGIQQEVVLLLAEKSPGIQSGIDVIELSDADDLERYTVQLRERRHLKAMDHAAEKWTQYYLEESEIALLRAARANLALPRFADFGCVDVGVVTGKNDFFVLSEAEAQEWGLTEYTLPLVGRTAQLPGLLYSESEWQSNRAAGVACHLLNLPSAPFEELPLAAQRYLESGQARDVHAGFKCRNRKFWYIVPSRDVSDAFLFRQIYAYPKMVANSARAISTDTIHRVRCHQPELAAPLAAAFLNSLTFAFAEVMGRSYGGGVLELEPNEADRLLLPFAPEIMLDSAWIDREERAGNIDAILQVNDALLLPRFGFTAAEGAQFRQIWRKLSGRRLGRKAPARNKATQTIL